MNFEQSFGSVSFNNILRHHNNVYNLRSTANNRAEKIRALQAHIGLLNAMNNGEGSMGKLMKDEALYNNIEGATKELEELLRDIKLHPKRYFRILSKKEIPYSEN